MQLISTTRLTGAFAMGVFGILAACSPREGTDDRHARHHAARGSDDAGRDAE